MLKLYPPTPEDLEELAENLRPADRLELERATGSDDLVDILQEYCHKGSEAYSVFDPFGKLVSIFGCAPIGTLVSAYGAPWCLGTDRLDKRSRALMVISRRYIHEWRKKYPTLVNFVDAENNLSIKFLAAHGFTFDEPVPFGPQGALFRRFWLEGIA